MEKLRPEADNSEKFCYQRIVVKIGSSTITAQGTRLDEEFIDGIAKQVAVLRLAGVEIVIVSSGAVASGNVLLNTNSGRIRDEQVAAIFGQPQLIAAWHTALARYNVLAGQVLLAEADVNKNGPLISALAYGVPIINANDAVNQYEMRQFAVAADNDRLASHVALSIQADLLVMLTDVAGVYDKTQTMIPAIEVSHDRSSLVYQKKSNVGTGGMASKVEQAVLFAEQGGTALITHGRTENIIYSAAQGKFHGTIIYKK